MVVIIITIKFHDYNIITFKCRDCIIRTIIFHHHNIITFKFRDGIFLITIIVS